MFLSRKSLERVDYAVKKVVLTTGSSVSELSLRVLREVRIFARLDHVNIVRFFNAWLEFVPNEKLDKELDNDPASEASFVTQGVFCGWSARIYRVSQCVSQIIMMLHPLVLQVNLVSPSL